MNEKVTQWLGTHWLSVIASLAVLGALIADLPFAYFQIMNWIVVGAAIVVARRTKFQPLMWLFIAIAVLFNPLAPIFLRADLWQIADVAVAICFIATFFIPEEKKK